MPTDQTVPPLIGTEIICANADSASTTSGTTRVPAPRLQDPTTPNGLPGTTWMTPTEEPAAPGDSFGDLVMVLAIAGAFGLILAIEVLAFVIFFARDSM